MDYRHTEDFARRMELAELRARALRREAIEQFWTDVGALLRRGWAATQRRLAGKATFAG